MFEGNNLVISLKHSHSYDGLTDFPNSMDWWTCLIWWTARYAWFDRLMYILSLLPSFLSLLLLLLLFWALCCCCCCPWLQSHLHIVVRRFSSFSYLSINERTLSIQLEDFIFVQEMIMSLTSCHVSYILFLCSNSYYFQYLSVQLFNIDWVWSFLDIFLS